MWYSSWHTCFSHLKSLQCLIEETLKKSVEIKDSKIQALETRFVAYLFVFIFLSLLCINCEFTVLSCML